MLSLPFAPKGIMQIRNQFKHASGVKFNSTLWNLVKETKGIWNKLKEIAKNDIEMLYKIQVKELGLKVAPDLKIAALPKGAAGKYDFNNGEMCINLNNINPLFVARENSCLRHELSHYKQGVQISRLDNGINQLETACINSSCKVEIELYKTNVKNHLKAKTQELATLDKASDAAKTIEAEIKGYQAFLELLDNNPKEAIMQVRPISIQQMEAELNSLKQQNASATQIAQHEQALKYYTTDPSLNAAFYERAIQENHNGQLIVQGSKEESVALSHLEGIKNYPDKSSLDYYKNPLELEAYTEQIKYTLYRPDNLSNITQGMANIADNPKK